MLQETSITSFVVYQSMTDIRSSFKTYSQESIEFYVGK